MRSLYLVSHAARFLCLRLVVLNLGVSSQLKMVLDGTQKDETIFGLLYEPDKTEGWEHDDLILKQANPVALEIPEIWEDLLKKRARAIAVESDRENFVCKHCNIIYQGLGTESFIDINDLQQCRVNKINWEGKEVYVVFKLRSSRKECRTIF